MSISKTDFDNPEVRTHLGKMIMQLFALWELDTASQLNLLGLSETSRALLSKLKRGDAPLAGSRDTLDRVGWLLAIHKALRLLYPKNPQLRYSWISRRNQAFNNYQPLEIMKQEGLIGLARVARYLDFLRGQ